ncbi:MAG: type II CAAX prenyl endopeptidase Rce1 family protein [Bacteroidia bacterium]
MTRQQTVLCSKCSRPFRPGARYCSGCGTAAPKEEDPEHSAGKNSLNAMLWFYGSLLVFIFIIRKIESVQGPEWAFGIDILFALLVLGFALKSYRELLPLLRVKDLEIIKIISVAITAILFGFLVIQISTWLHQNLFHSGQYNEMYMFEDSAFPLLFSILSIAVQPAFFEELGFRGLIYSHIEKAGGGAAALLVSSFMFAILHLNIISLLWLVPAGLTFGWLRQRYNTIWYGITGHFFYNSTIVVIDFYSRAHLH